MFSTANIYIPQPGSVRELPFAPNQELFCTAKCSTELIVKKNFEEPRSYDIALNEDFNNPLMKVQITGIEVEKWDVTILSFFLCGNPNIGLSPIVNPRLIEILTLALGADCKGQQWIIYFHQNVFGERYDVRGTSP